MHGFERRTGVTVVIPTRNRAAAVVRAVASTLEGTRAPAEVIVVDQSEDDEAESGLDALADPRVRCLRSATRGISAGLNRGIDAARTATIAITGDDCEVAATWLEALAAELEADASLGVVFGSVVPGAHDGGAGFIPGYVVPVRTTATRVQDQHAIGGTSACMGLRRSVWQQLGGFDETLGVGAPLGSAEDTDFGIRALLAGWHVVESPAPTVVHTGFFRWSERAPLIERNWYGTGAAFAKAVRLGRAQIAPVLLHLGLRWLRGRSPIGSGLGRGPYRAAAFAAFGRGVAAGFRHRLDAETGHFAAAGERAAAPHADAAGAAGAVH